MGYKKKVLLYHHMHGRVASGCRYCGRVGMGVFACVFLHIPQRQWWKGAGFYV